MVLMTKYTYQPWVHVQEEANETAQVVRNQDQNKANKQNWKNWVHIKQVSETIYAVYKQQLLLHLKNQSNKG